MRRQQWDAGEDSLESRQESCCGRGDDESKIRRWGRRQAAAGELAGMLVCNGDDGGRVVEGQNSGRASYYCACAMDEMVCVRAMEQTSS
jgi:hypothetical protein